MKNTAPFFMFFLFIILGSKAEIEDKYIIGVTILFILISLYGLYKMYVKKQLSKTKIYMFLGFIVLTSVVTAYFLTTA